MTQLSPIYKSASFAIVVAEEVVSGGLVSAAQVRSCVGLSSSNTWPS